MSILLGGGRTCFAALAEVAKGGGGKKSPINPFPRSQEEGKRTQQEVLQRSSNTGQKNLYSTKKGAITEKKPDLLRRRSLGGPPQHWERKKKKGKGGKNGAGRDSVPHKQGRKKRYHRLTVPEPTRGASNLLRDEKEGKKKKKLGTRFSKTEKERNAGFYSPKASIPFDQRMQGGRNILERCPRRTFFGVGEKKTNHPPI